MRKLAFIVATKDRPDDLRKLLESLLRQTIRPVQIVIVDSSQPSVESVANEFPDLPIAYQSHWPPSAAAQRNAGLAAVAPEANLVGFIDDDAVLEEDAIERMLKYWEEEGDDLGGAAFNMMNPIVTKGQGIKRSWLVERLGLYGRSTGQVMPSGWQTNYDTLTETSTVQWLPTGAVVWRREIFEREQFDEYFEGYSYCEDLEFSYRVGKAYRLAVIADARYYHYPSTGGRVSGYHFGKVEVINRLYFVRKHQLSLSRYLLAMHLRMFLTLFLWARTRRRNAFERLSGNVVALVNSALTGFNPAAGLRT